MWLVGLLFIQCTRIIIDCWSFCTSFTHIYLGWFSSSITTVVKNYRPFLMGNELKLFFWKSTDICKIPKMSNRRMLFIVDRLNNNCNTSFILFSSCLRNAIWLDALESKGTWCKHWLKVSSNPQKWSWRNLNPPRGCWD